ncbi:MAG TPA: hypothetical protein VF844_05825 [Ktedonobacteraceae bacterium]
MHIGDRHARTRGRYSDRYSSGHWQYPYATGLYEAGDTVSVEIERLGVLTNPLVAEE